MKLYLQMSNLRQIFALIGSFNDLNNEEGEFVHRMVKRELGISDVKKFKEKFSKMRKYASNLIDKKIKMIG